MIDWIAIMRKKCAFICFSFFASVHGTTFVMQGLCLDWVTKVTGFFSRNARAQSIEHLQMTYLSKPHLKGEFRNKLKVAF